MPQKRRSIEIIVVLSLGTFLLAACGSLSTEPVVEIDLPTAAVAVEELPQVEVAEEAPEAGEPVEEQASEGASTFAPGFELGSSTLVSTDPSTVSLASGQIQVLEFFAFW